MEKMQRQTRVMLVCAIILSVMFPLGIVGIVLTAINKMIPLVIMFAVMTGFCFYAVPIMWTSYGTKLQHKKVLSCIEIDRYENVDKISSATQISKKEVASIIRSLIGKSCLHGYAFDGENLQIIEEGKLKSPSKSGKVKCPNCGASYQINDENGTCPYCES